MHYKTIEAFEKARKTIKKSSFTDEQKVALNEIVDHVRYAVKVESDRVATKKQPGKWV